MDLGQVWEEGLRDFGGSFFVGEEAGVADDREIGVGEVGDHFSGQPDREEAVLLSPDELDGDVDLLVQRAEVAHVLVVEALQQAHRRLAVWAGLDDGLSQLTFGRLAKRLGISDRIVVYYFPSKDDLIGDVLVALGARLQAALAPALSAPVADHVELVRAAWPILAHPDADPLFALLFEAGGLAAIKREPYHTLVAHLVQAWIDWASSFINGTPTHRRIEAETAIATIDGLLLLRQLAGPETADRAARRIDTKRSRRPR